MQKSVFSHFGADFQTAGAADLGPANFTTAKNSGKMVLWRGIMQSKAANSVFREVWAVFALSRARVSSLSLSLSRSVFGAF